MSSEGLDIGVAMDPRQAANLLQNPEGIAEMLHDEAATDDTPAEIFADIINVMRADIRRLAIARGVDIEANRVTPERAAELLAGTVAGDGVDIVEMFNEQAAGRDRLLRDELSEEEYETFMAAKHEMMHTGDPGVPNDE